jgi:uncharacterized membrane protein YbhN (UPF0104 family)
MPHWPRGLRTGIGLTVFGVAVVYLTQVVSGAALADAASAVAADPAGLMAALTCYAAAFALRAAVWTHVLPGLRGGHAWAALHVSLLGNHVLPLRLGEVLRVTSVTRRTGHEAAPVVASTVLLRAADLLAVLVLALAAAPGLVLSLTGAWIWPIGVLLVAVAAAGFAWLRRTQAVGSAGPALLALPVAAAAWALESAVVFQIADAAGVPLTPYEAVAVTAVTIAAQTVAISPGGIGSYEAAATAALTALGTPAGPAFAVALLTHAVKTAYSLVTGAIALCVPAPPYFGRLRLPRALPSRPAAPPVEADAPVVVFIPAFNEEESVGQVVTRLPRTVHDREVITIVVNDGSTDATAGRAAQAGARVVDQPRNLGLGAAVRRGLAEATALHPAAVVYLDADGEYFPEDIQTVVDPVLHGTADYVVGSRFTGDIQRMLPHRRFGNLVLTRWMRWITRRRDLTDGQSGYRAFAPGAAATAEIIHDYNYAQVLTLDLLAKGYRYQEVPIGYTFRQTGTSFIKLGRYLRKVVPAVHRELNAR